MPCVVCESQFTEESTVFFSKTCGHHFCETCKTESKSCPLCDEKAKLVRDFDALKTECPVCLTEYQDNKEILSKCGHSCCLTCANQLDNCPICRKAIAETFPNVNHVRRRDLISQRINKRTNFYGVRLIDNKPRGWGILRRKHLFTRGLFVDGLLEGPGVCKVNDTVMRGIFHRGKLSGPGSLMRKDREYFQGELEEGVYHGYGVYRFKQDDDLLTFRGLFKFGMMYSGRITDSKFNFVKEIVKGNPVSGQEVGRAIKID